MREGRWFKKRGCSGEPEKGKYDEDDDDLPRQLMSFERRERDDRDDRVRATRSIEDDGFAHVLVDEAQDLSPMQLRMLARRCPGGSMTLVGDLGQASGPWAPARWEDVLTHLPVRRPPARAELSVNYRTPSEVMDLAARVLEAATPGLAPPASVRSAGIDPLMTAATPDGLAPMVAAVATSELEAVGDGADGVVVTHGTGRKADAAGVSPFVEACASAPWRIVRCIGP